MNKIKLILIGLAVVGGGAGTIWIQGVFAKLKERKELVIENNSLRTDKKLLGDSLHLHKEYLAKALIDTKNATELYSLTKSMSGSFQGVIKVMRDSVIKINKDRAKLETKVLELEKALEKAKQKRKFL